jgi:hypothetical protein
LFIRLAVPLLIAFLPQSTFYAINNDVLTPLTFGAAFVLLLKLFDAEKLSPLTAAAAGLALAAAFLTKTSNVPLVAACAVFVGLQILILAWRRKLGAAFLPLLVLLLTAALPMAHGWPGAKPISAITLAQARRSRFWAGHKIRPNFG